MTYFAAVPARDGDRWTVTETSLADCESLGDVGDLLRDAAGEVRIALVEQDDEYAVIVRLDDDADDPRAFLSDGHAADNYPIAALVAEDLDEIGGDALSDDEDAPPAHDSAPFGDPEIVADLGTGAGDLLALCAHEGTLPIEVLVAVCDKAGFGAAFEDLRG